METVAEGISYDPKTKVFHADYEISGFEMQELGLVDNPDTNKELQKYEENLLLTNSAMYKSLYTTYICFSVVHKDDRLEFELLTAPCYKYWDEVKGWQIEDMSLDLVATTAGTKLLERAMTMLEAEINFWRASK